VEGRVFGPQLLKTTPSFSWSDLVLGSIAREITASEVHGLEHDGVLLVAHGVAGRDTLQADRCAMSPAYTS